MSQNTEGQERPRDLSVSEGPVGSNAFRTALLKGSKGSILWKASIGLLNLTDSLIHSTKPRDIVRQGHRYSWEGNVEDMMGEITHRFLPNTTRKSTDRLRLRLFVPQLHRLLAVLLDKSLELSGLFPHPWNGMAYSPLRSHLQWEGVWPGGSIFSRLN